MDIRNEIAKQIHYPEHWETTVYPTLENALHEIGHTVKSASENNQYRFFKCGLCEHFKHYPELASEV